MRLAACYECSYLHFCKKVLGLTSEEIGQLHAVLPEKALVILAEGTGAPIEDLRTRDIHTIWRTLSAALDQCLKTHPDAFDAMMHHVRNVYK